MNESLIKYLAGLLDADGSLVLTFKQWGDGYYLGLELRLASSDAVDKKGFVSSLPTLTGMGCVVREGPKKQFVNWRIGKRAELEMILPRLVKHMVIKARHWQRMLQIWREFRGVQIVDDFRDELRIGNKESRITNVGPLKPKNHPAWAWLAGYLDGDGCYGYRCCPGTKNGRTYQQWNISVSACAHDNDRSVLDFLQRAFGGVIREHGQSDCVKVWWRNLGYQQRSFALRFLPNVAKHSRLKRDKIDAIIHHHRQRLSVPGTERRYCEVEGCGQPRHGNGLCSLHYQRKRREVQATV